MTSAGFSRSISSRMRSRHVSASRYSGDAIDRQPLAAQLDLVLGLLAGAVENRTDVARHVRRHLQQQRGFADARLAAEQHERAGDDAATQDAIELVDAGGHSRRVRGLNVAVELGRRAPDTRP